MVISRSTRIHRQRASLIMEALVAMAIVVGTLMPIAYSIASETKLARSYYERAIAMEIVDGEMEALAAGEWRTFEPGTHSYAIHANAATNLPPGSFWLTIETNTVRLVWQPALRQHGGKVVREVTVK